MSLNVRKRDCVQYDCVLPEGRAKDPGDRSMEAREVVWGIFDGQVCLTEADAVNAAETHTIRARQRESRCALTSVSEHQCPYPRIVGSMGYTPCRHSVVDIPTMKCMYARDPFPLALDCTAYMSSMRFYTMPWISNATTSRQREDSLSKLISQVADLPSR